MLAGNRKIWERRQKLHKFQHLRADSNIRKEANGKVKLKKGDIVYSPRFCHLELYEVFENRAAAQKAGYSEPTGYSDSEYGILGKSIGLNKMIFAAYRKEGKM